MAFGYTIKKQGVMGDLQYKVYTVDFASVTSGHIPTGLSNVVFATFNNDVSEDGKLEQNRNSGDSATEYGGVLLNSFTSNDTGTVFVIGY
jgi:hypothetical protein